MVGVKSAKSQPGFDQWIHHTCRFYFVPFEDRLIVMSFGQPSNGNIMTPSGERPITTVSLDGVSARAIRSVSAGCQAGAKLRP